MKRTLNALLSRSESIIEARTMRKTTYLFCLVLIFILPWEDSISAESVGSLARLIGIVVAGFWLGTIIIEGRFRKPDFFHALVLLFILWNFVSVFWSVDVESTLRHIKTYSQIFLLVLIYWDVFQKPEKLMAGLQAYIFGAYVLVASTIYNFMMGNVAIQYEDRYSANGVNAVEQALMLMIGLPIAMQLFFAAKNRKRPRLLNALDLLYIPLSIFATILTGSRTSLIAIIPFGILVLAAQQIKANQKFFMLVLLVISILISLPFIPETIIARLSTIGSSVGGGDLGGRVGLWREAIAVLAKHPILGVGSGAVASMIGAVVHNTFISVFAETGFIGFLLFLSILGWVVYKVVRLPRRLAELWLAILMIWAIGVLSLSWEVRKVTWMVLSFALIESSLGERAAEQELPSSLAPILITAKKMS